MAEEIPNSSQLMTDVAKAYDSVERILNSTDAEFYSRSFLYERVNQVGVPYNLDPVFSPSIDCMNASHFGMLQVPSEFTDYLLTLASLPIATAIEIGVMTGAAAYLAAAVLQRKNPNAIYHMVDLYENIVGFSQFSKRLNLVKHVPKTSDDFHGQTFDLVFIDADHSYNGVKRDFVNVGRYAKVAVALHDIRGHEYDHLDGGPVRFWGEFCSRYGGGGKQILSFAHSSLPTMGLGIGINRG